MVSPLLLLLLAPVPIGLLVAVRPAYGRAILSDIRPGRIVHYFLVFLFGFGLKHTSPDQLSTHSTDTWLLLALFLFCLTYAAFFAIATNNRADLEIDRITNTDRPLVRETIAERPYLVIAAISLAIALFLSFSAHWVFGVGIAGISAVYYLYSCSPFRLKRFVLLAKFLIGINTLLAAMCGFVIAGGNWWEFPLFWTLFILIPVSLMANFIDLKDTPGDRAAGIRTLPVLLGDDKARLLIGGFTLVAYVMVFTYFRSLIISLLLLATCSLHLFLLLRRPYREKPLFLFHNTLFLGLNVLVQLETYLKNE